MDPLHFCVAVAPLSVYFLMVGLITLSGRPFVTTGTRDTAALGIGIVGLVVAGPMELFFPEEAASQFGGMVWLLLLAFYGLCVSLVVLLLRSRLVVYNMTGEQLKPILNQVATQIDKKARWVGDSVLIPDIKVHLHLESVDWLRNVQLIAGGNQQSFDGWRLLEKELRSALGSARVSPNLLGVAVLLASGGLAVTAAGWMLYDQQAVAQALDQMLRR
ncbi:MAG: hypothetical protein VYE64_00290 [Planctomycetota bacterium]|nr:hypothetical protein [Planctomycetota bacterium]